MKAFPALLCCAFLSCVFTALATGADQATLQVRALLVLASKQQAPSDPHLAPYESNLRRILRFESFKLVGESNAAVSSAKKTNLSLGQGHVVELGTESPTQLRVNWTQNGRSLMNTGLSLRPGVPAVLGGPSNGKDGEVWAVLLVTD